MILVKNNRSPEILPQYKMSTDFGFFYSKKKKMKEENAYCNLKFPVFGLWWKFEQHKAQW